MEAKDVWRDDAYNYTGQTLDYAVKMNGVVVKKGHASAKDFPITIYLNRLAVDYLEVDWHNRAGFAYEEWSGGTRILGRFYEMPDAAAQFTLVRLEGDTEVETLYDVVYVDTSRGELKTYLSEPINGHACTQQVLPYTVYGGWSGDTPEPPGPEPPGPDSGYTGQYFTLVPRSDGRIRFEFRSMASASVEADSYYSTDSGATWHKTYLGEILQLYAGEKVMFKGVNDYLFFHTIVEIHPNTPSNSPEIECGFITNCDYDIEGNIMSLFYGDDFQDKTEFPSVEFAEDTDFLYGMFDPEGYTYHHRGGQIVNARNLVLPVLDLHMPTSYGSITGGIYGGMFANCTKLETAPALPATALEDHCYESMFAGCTSLTTPPDLPATQLAESCYKNMFGNCTELRTAPALPATTLATSCYYVMFGGCTSLNVAPILPAPTLVDDCYGYMFEDCGNISSVQCLATNPTQAKVMLWLKNVSDTGVFVKAAGVTWPVGESGIPSGWRIVNA